LSLLLLFILYVTVVTYTDNALQKCYSEYLQEVASQAARRLVLEEGYRVDGRGVTDMRPIWSRAGCLLRVDGSALCTWGKTQALAVTIVATLGELHLAGRISCPRVTC